MRSIEHPAGPAYRAWLAAGGTKSREMDPFEARDSFWECAHGRLAHDAWRDPDCTCWTANPSRTPDLMGVLTNAERKARMTAMSSDAVVEFVRTNGPTRRSEIVAHFGCDDTRASHILTKLTLDGHLRGEGERGGRRYVLPDGPELVPDPPAAAPIVACEPIVDAIAVPDPIAAAMHQIEKLIFADEAEVMRLRANITRLQAAHGVLDDLLPAPVMEAVA